MKNFLQNLLILFAFTLCALIAFQWVRETRMQGDIQSLTNTVQDKSQAILDLQASIRREEAEIKRLDGLKNQLTETVKSNDVQIASLTKDLDKANADRERDQRQIEVYKDALQKANENITRQNDDIKKQNEQLKLLAGERNVFVQGFNGIAVKFNDLAQEWNKLNAALTKVGTNAPLANATFVAEYNQVVAKFGDLAGEWNKMEQTLQNNATNAPPP